MMKRCCVLLLTAIVMAAAPSRAKCQSFEVSQLLLNVEKLNQLREILDKMYDGYKILSEGYQKIKDVTSGNFKIHDIFLDGLFLINPEIQKYRRVVDIIENQLYLVKEYKAAYNGFKNSGAFNVEQIEYIANVYEKLFSDSMENLDELLIIITARQVRMSDDERLAAIDRIYESVTKKLKFLRVFNSQQAMLGVSRLQDKYEMESLKTLHGLE